MAPVTQVEIGPPGAVDPDVVAAVRAAVAGRAAVRAAYLITLRDGDAPPRLVAGIALVHGYVAAAEMPPIAAAITAALPPGVDLDVIALSRRVLAAVRRQVPPVWPESVDGPSTDLASRPRC